ncbi:EamA family transporter, partial [Alistipes putredinis]|uniref:EamA family transporter n=1 Tax=Alistipes putredinis TaxID=28117 RepID=UPI0023AF2A88
MLMRISSSRGESGGGSIAGDIITLVSSVCYAIYLTACRKVILKYSPVTTMKWMFFFAAIVVVVLYHRPALEVDFPAVPARVWGGAAFAFVLSTFLAYLMVP